MPFERLFVSAPVRKDGEEAWNDALGGLQGRRLAKRAYLEGKPLLAGGGEFEMREHFGPGWRVYYIQREAVLIVMLGRGDKSTQSADIAKAVKLAAYFQG
jgi:putative addiction module killer protein